LKQAHGGDSVAFSSDFCHRVYDLCTGEQGKERKLIEFFIKWTAWDVRIVAWEFFVEVEN
jgi:hypothetical protein